MKERYLICLNDIPIKAYKQRLSAKNCFSRMMHSDKYKYVLVEVIGLASGHVYCTNKD